MNKKILLTLLFALLCILSISAIQASDVNITDSNTIGSSDDTIQIDGESLSSGVESDTSNTLSTDNEEPVLEEDSKNQTELTAPTNTVYYKGSYNVTLKDSNTNDTLANKEVNFVINDVNYTAKTDDNGVASLNLTLKPGKYTAIAYFLGDEIYWASNNLTSTLEVLSTIKASDITKYYKGSTKYTATFYDSYGNVLANRDVNITVNGKSYTRKTNSNGVAIVPVNLGPGTYKVTTTNPDNGYKITTKFKILPTISASSMKKVAGGNPNKFVAKFYKSNGKALANKYIRFKLDGKTYKVKTDSKGKAKLSIKNLKKGTHYIVCYNTDGSSKTVKIKVYSKVSTKLLSKDYTFMTGDSIKRLKVTLNDAFDHIPSAGKIIKITFNGKTYKKKTNSKGVVYLKLPSVKKGAYTVKYVFSGAGNYKASKVSHFVTVLSTKKSVLTVKSTKTFGYGASTPLKVRATAGGVALPKRAMTFNVDGKTYTRTTDGNGIASLPIKLAIGNYTVKYSINKESKVNAKSASLT